MSAPTVETVANGPSGGRPAPGRAGGTWTLTPAGVATVARLELRQRVRSSRWIVVLAVWFAVLAVLTWLVRTAVLGTFAQDDARAKVEAGRIVFGIIVFLVLSLGALVAPALSATSVNGDRNAGVLATLQTTLLSPAEIVIGKLIAAWAVALALLVAASPFLLWSFVDGGTSVGRVLVVLVVLALTLLVVCAIGLGWSAISARTSGSAVLTYLTVAFLGLGLPLLFGLSVLLVSNDETVTVRQLVPTDETATTYRCETVQSQQNVTHTERTWWILAMSPYVVVADASPVPSGDVTSSDPLTGIRNGVRALRLGPSVTSDECSPSDAPLTQEQVDRQRRLSRLSPTWPLGLAADLALGGLFTVIAIRRLRAPARTLPRGTRVA